MSITDALLCLLSFSRLKSPMKYDYPLFKDVETKGQRI